MEIWEDGKFEGQITGCFRFCLRVLSYIPEKMFWRNGWKWCQTMIWESHWLAGLWSHFQEVILYNREDRSPETVGLSRLAYSQKPKNKEGVRERCDHDTQPWAIAVLF